MPFFVTKNDFHYNVSSVTLIHGYIDWVDAPDTPTSFMDEARRIATDGGIGKGDARNYNMINSPGKIQIEKGMQ